jgi:hypothetical protein
MMQTPKKQTSFCRLLAGRETPMPNRIEIRVF